MDPRVSGHSCPGFHRYAWNSTGTWIASTAGMSSHVPTSSPSYHIAQTEKGWQLRIQNEHCSVVQVFRSASDARLAVDRLMEFFKAMSAQAPPEAA
jgi:hypothetical protein